MSSPMGKGLTKAQREYLKAMADRPISARSSYRPARALFDLGYATRARIQWTPIYVYTITDAGRAALGAQHDQG